MLLAVLVLVSSASPGAAETMGCVIQRLATEGYSTIRVERTWLGRERIVGIGPTGTREIVLNPSTGEVLRDHVEGEEPTREARLAPPAEGRDPELGATRSLGMLPREATGSDAEGTDPGSRARDLGRTAREAGIDLDCDEPAAPGSRSGDDGSGQG